ncbi:MAG TPA: Spy/CpxP family protein refolding chaperone [Burkholderiales bacterium]|nr:Spy/CpxP family protein refolding chaperone [Burkholderiales bacterium]
MKLFAAILFLSLALPASSHEKSHGQAPPAQPAPAAEEEQAFGRPGDPKKVAREVLVTMGDDMRFRPGAITVRQGETVRFRVKNNGKVVHELVLGTMKDLKDHAEMMKKHPGMEHDEPYMVHVAPGKTGTIVWQFTKAGEFHYGCLVAGHFEAGMVGKLTVTSYAGQEQRELKSLSAEEVEQYRSGAGMGYAKSAELNHFPGPMHALELADRLKLTPEQKAKTGALMQAHKAEARAIGAKLVDAEARIETLFRSGDVQKEQLEAAVKAASALQGEYRLSHLETHRRMRALLTPEQVAAYDEARGYGKGMSNHSHGKKHH